MESINAISTPECQTFLQDISHKRFRTRHLLYLMTLTAAAFPAYTAATKGPAFWRAQRAWAAAHDDDDDMSDINRARTELASADLDPRIIGTSHEEMLQREISYCEKRSADMRNDGVQQQFESEIIRGFNRGIGEAKFELYLQEQDRKNGKTPHWPYSR